MALYTQHILWAQLLSSKYDFHLTNSQYFLYNIRSTNTDSYIWKSMTKVSTLCTQGTSWNVATGHAIHMWHDHWIAPNTSLHQLIQGYLPHHETFSPLTRIIRNNKWDLSYLSFILPPHVINLINNTLLHASPQTVDQPFWNHTPTGFFSTSSANHQILQTTSNIPRYGN